jgi:CHAT domain-containing protein
MSTDITRFTLTGTKQNDTEYTSLKAWFPDAEIESYNLEATRSDGMVPLEVSMTAKDVVVMQFENDITWFYSGTDFTDKVKQQAPAGSRSGTTSGNDTLEIPSSWENGTTSRGIFTKALKLLGFKVVKNAAGEKLAGVIAKKIEAKNPNELYNCGPKMEFTEKFDATKSSDQPYLLLLHGTASNTKSSFDGLVKTQNGQVYDALYKKYDGRIIAYEHRTFSQSPIQNIIELLPQLPDNIQLDLLSHSRGGLLGEILARAAAAEIDNAFTAEETRLLELNTEAAALLAQIKQLHKALAKKKITVNRFVRVACPAAGTLLLSDRMDTVLNVIFNILGLIPGETFGIVLEGLKALITAVVNERSDFDTLPGLECMRPESNFIKVLNFGNTSIQSNLVVIAGDAVGEGFINRIKMFLVDQFYKEDNDLIVHTASMVKGTARTGGFKIYHEQNGSVDHFHYFINASSQKIIEDALAGNTTQSRGFMSSNVAQSETAPAVAVNRSTQPIGNQPVLYVLPGIMGSNLNAGDERIWLNIRNIAKGGLGQLADMKASSIKADGINGSAYGSMVKYFSNTHHVIPFAYDWRKSIFEAADALARDVNTTLQKTKTAISFIAHSMGGLVLMAFRHQHESIWKELVKRSNFRVLLMGVPIMGSYDTIRVLQGGGKKINLLALLDLTHSKKQLLEQFIKYPGMLQLLPAKGMHDFGDMQIWKEIEAAAQQRYPVPDPKELKAFTEIEKLRSIAAGNQFWDTNIIKYIAGTDDQTPCKIEIQDKKVNFIATPQGDGTVTWQSIPAALSAATYYVAAEHGNIAACTDAFDGYKELLEKGETDKLTKNQPVTRGETKEELMPESEPVSIPDENELSSLIMGIKVKSRKLPLQKIKVSITHGDMGHATYPVIAGHFLGDGLVLAERVLNDRLQNYFGIRHLTNNYPGDIGTHELIISPKTEPPGGVVVGLGAFGQLNENLLTKTLKQALLTYIIKNGETTNSYPEKKEAKELGIAYLLIGTGFGGLSIYSSLKAILNAVNEANTFFKANFPGRYPLLANVEVIELHQYKAVQAARILHNLLKGNERFSNIVFLPETIKRVSGSRNEIPDETQHDWWHRLQVREEKKDNNQSSRIIKFNSITDKARNEETVLATNIQIVDRLIAATASVKNNDKELCETLYEMLMPNEFKGYGSDLRNIVLLVDKETARYPWEMLRDAYGGNQDPIVTKAGFLRQLSTSTYRINTELSTNNKALVIGNPQLDNYYPDLPGAAVEAKLVARMLRGKDYEVTEMVEKQGMEIIQQLYPKAYKILHIAAHGVVNDKGSETAEKKGQTGVVLGKELVITPADFNQMRYVPELVFINCCSLGTINKADEERLQRKYEVAAGVGTQLIEMGVKAVIVAGWEVDDDAAKCFSETFYTALLNNRNFGDAVKAARETTYTTYKTVNTWGAYQCYGDPYYMLRNSNNQGNKKEPVFVFSDPVEAINKLQTLLSKIEADGEVKNNYLPELNAVIAAVKKHPEWETDGVITELIAEVYKESGKRAEAINWYEKLFNLNIASYSVKAIEQYCNTKIKQAVNDCDDKKITVAAADKIILDCIKQLENIHTNLTTERASLIASAWKRKAEVDKDNIRNFNTALLEATSYYYTGHDLFYTATKKVNYYPFYNWLILAACIAPQVNPKGKTEAAFLTIPTGNALALLKNNAADYCDERELVKPDFWNKTAASMGYLFDIITAASETAAIEAKGKIIYNHEQAWEGSKNKQNAVLEHIKFIIIALKKRRSTTKNLTREKIQVLNQLVKELKYLMAEQH